MKKSTLKPRTPNLVVAYQNLVSGKLFKRRSDAGGLNPVKKVKAFQGTDGKTISINPKDITKANHARQVIQHWSKHLRAMEDAKTDAREVSKKYPYPMRSEVYNAIYKSHMDQFNRTHKRPKAN